eukprot:2931283-Rhodomonas_salina.1
MVEVGSEAVRGSARQSTRQIRGQRKMMGQRCGDREVREETWSDYVRVVWRLRRKSERELCHSSHCPTSPNSRAVSLSPRLQISYVHVPPLCHPWKVKICCCLARVIRTCDIVDSSIETDAVTPGTSKRTSQGRPLCNGWESRFDQGSGVARLSTLVLDDAQHIHHVRQSISRGAYGLKRRRFSGQAPDYDPSSRAYAMLELDIATRKQRWMAFGTFDSGQCHNNASHRTPPRSREVVIVFPLSLWMHARQIILLALPPLR